MLKKIALVLISPIIVFLIVEIALRIYFSVFGTEMDRIMYVYSAEQIAAQNTAFVGLPFVGYGPSPDHPEHNQLGYRNREITIEKPAGVYRIVTVGGSTTYGSGVSANETWSAQLETVLHEEYDLDFIEVINTASVGYTTWNSLANLTFRVLDLEPDLVIIYHNTNDAKARDIDPACFTGQSPIRGLARGIWNINGPALSPLVTVRYIGRKYGVQPNPIDLNKWILPVTWSDPDCRAPESMTTLELLAANPPIYFERNLRNMIYLAQHHGAEVMLSTWAYHPALAIQKYVSAYETQNQIILQLADEMDVYAYDLMSALPVNEALWFFDGEHQNADGHLQQAQRYAAFIAGTIQPVSATASTARQP